MVGSQSGQSIMRATLGVAGASARREMNQETVCIYAPAFDPFGSDERRFNQALKTAVWRVINYKD